MNGFYTIAIDGPSGAGKSSLARRLAGMFQFIYVDTGAIYRTVGLAAYRAGIDRRDEAAIAALLPEIQITMGYNEAGEQRMYLDGEDVSAEIRLPEISICASAEAGTGKPCDHGWQRHRYGGAAGGGTESFPYRQC